MTHLFPSAGAIWRKVAWLCCCYKCFSLQLQSFYFARSTQTAVHVSTGNNVKSYY